jgi:hypothetical protein
LLTGATVVQIAATKKLNVLLAVVCVIMRFVGTPFAVGLFPIKTSDAYQTATRFLASNEKVKGQIGEITQFFHVSKRGNTN